MKKGKGLSIASIVCFILSIVMAISAFAYYETSSYSYYWSQYSTCRDGYIDCINARNQYYSSSYFYEAYDEMADEYDDLMDFWQGKMTEIEVVAWGLGGTGGALFIASIVLRIVSSSQKKKAKKAVVANGQMYGQVPYGQPGAVPVNGYAQPNGTYAPQQPYAAAPQQTYAPQQQTYAAPQQAYAPQQQTYAAPQQAYAPQQYAAPQQTYAAPQAPVAPEAPVAPPVAPEAEAVTTEE